MVWKNIEHFKKYPVILWGHPKGTHTNSWIHFRFHRAFKYLGYDVRWVENKIANLPDKNTECIIITENLQDSVLLENYNRNWKIFDHNISFQKYKEYGMEQKGIIPFGVVRYNLAKFTDKKVGQYITEWDTPVMDMEDYYFRMRHPSILWGSELLPHEMKHVPYHYKNTNDIVFIGSWWHNNFIQLETLRFWSLFHGKNYQQLGKHIILRPPLTKRGFISEDKITELTQNAYIAPTIQGVQVDDGYIPCRLFINMSMSVLAVSNNPYVYNLFDDDEVIVDRSIFSMMEKAERIIKDRKVDLYTKKALKKVQEKHTYVNRIEELFGYL